MKNSPYAAPGAKLDFPFLRNLALLLALLLLAPAMPLRAADEEPGWEPARTWLFIVGLLEWQDKDMFGSFPKEGRRDDELVEFFEDRGVPESQIVHLQDDGATQKEIDTAFVNMLRKVRPGDLVLVYYAGHGYLSDDGKDVYLASYDAGIGDVAGWSVKSIPKTIEKNAPGVRVLWLIDCCHSGRAVEVIRTRTGNVAYACAAASLASQVSTGHWTFTDAVLDALRGKAYVDLNNDGNITLAEFAKHVAADMNAAEEQQSTFGVSGGFDPETLLSVASPREHPRIGERVRVESDGDWYASRIVEEKDGEFRVHFIGYDPDEDMWVAPTDMKPLSSATYAVGDKVEVLWKKKWYPATVLEVNGGVQLIHYDGFDSDWDEWVSSKRVRRGKN